MEEKKRYPEPVLREGEDVEIDWAGIFAKLLKGWKLIAIVTVLFGAFGVLYSLRMPRVYSVTVTLAPELQQRASSLSGLTSMMGLRGISALTGESDAMSVLILPEICKSTPFLSSLFDTRLAPYYSPEDKLAGVPEKPSVTVFDHIMGYDKPVLKPFSKKQMEVKEKYDAVYDDDTVCISSLTPNQARVVKKLRNCIVASVDQKTWVTSISVTLDDPAMVTQLADTVTVRLQDYVGQYRTRKARSDWKYYESLKNEAHDELVAAQQAYAANVDYDRSVILQSVNSERERLQQEAALANQMYSQMVQQAELAKAKIQQDRPIYAVIQPATQPSHPSGSRKKMVLIWIFAGGVLSCFWVAFGMDFFMRAKNDIGEKLAEEKK